MRRAVRRAALAALGLGLLFPASMVLAVSAYAQVVGYLFAYAAGVSGIAIALLLPAGRAQRVLLGAGLGVLLTSCALRLSQVQYERADLRVITLPEARSTRWVNAFVPEREGAVLAAELLGLPPQGDDTLPDVLRTAYARMDHALGPVPTPAIATYLGMQHSGSFDAVVVEPRAPGPPSSALIFLHGYAGNFDVYCWYAARAAQATRTLVVCPSLGPRGDFWNPHGLLTVRATLAYLHARGIRRVVLAGLSNGAVGAGVIAPQIARELEGVILISGAPGRAPPPALPLLVIQGERDTMMPAAMARRYAARAGVGARYVAIEGGHFVFLSHTDRVTEEIGRWLERRFRQGP